MDKNNFTKVNSGHIERLREMVGSEKVIEGSLLSEDYAHDELSGTFGMPDVLVKPACTKDVSRVMAFASSESIPVVVRGSGTGLVGGAVAVCGGIMLDTTGMNHIIELDKQNLTVTAEPGVLLMELAAFAEENGFLYPPDPGEKSATIGGNISTNAGGMRAVKYGVTRDYVRELEVVMPSGEVHTFGGKVVKNSTGYSLKDLVIGSEGTLCIITKAVLKLVPKPAASVSILVPFKSTRDALAAVPEIIKCGVQCTAIEYMERETLLFSEEYLGKKFPDTGAEFYLLLTADGASDEAVNSAYSELAELCLELSAIDAYLVDTEERLADVWNARGAFLEAIKASTSEMDECDVVVPRHRVAEFIMHTHEMAAKYGMRIPSFGHAGDGNLHIYLCRDGMDEKEFSEKMQAAFDEMYDLAFSMGGMVSGEHGVGYAKRAYMQRQLGQGQIEIMKGIKKVFDPCGILNPHKVII